LIQEIDDVVQKGTKVKFEKVTETDLATAKSYLRMYSRIVPTLTDWTSLIVMRRNDISKILSLDSDFANVKRLKEFRWVQRINEPTQLEALF
jgi:predicted nucleic acid-binding protein